MAKQGFHERFMLTWCPEYRDEEDEDKTLINALWVLKRSFHNIRRRGCEAEYTIEYGKSNRLHFHIVLMFRNANSLFTFNKCIWRKLAETGYVKKSSYHDYLAEYLEKEQAIVSLKVHHLIPTKFSLETLERIDIDYLINEIGI